MKNIRFRHKATTYRKKSNLFPGNLILLICLAGVNSPLLFSAVIDLFHLEKNIQKPCCYVVNL